MASGRNDGDVLREASGSFGKVLEAVEPYARRQVLRLYGKRGDEIAVCPGEANCEIWQSAAGKDHKQRERNACHPCSLFNTKTDSGRRSHRSLENLASNAMAIRNERLTGYPRKESLMSNWEFFTLYAIEQMVEQEEIQLKRDNVDVLLAAFDVKKG